MNKKSILTSTDTRRRFLKQCFTGSLGILLADLALADPYRPLPRIWTPSQPLRIQGRVTSKGKGIAGVGVTDGLQVVATKADGSFEIQSNTNQSFVSLSMPSGYKVPLNPTGTASFYKALPEKGNQTFKANFELLAQEDPDDQHQILVLADPQTQDQEEMQRFHNETIPDVQAWLKTNAAPAYSVACGDIMFDHLELYPEYEKAVQKMGIPGFQVVGNHDVNVAAKTEETSVKTFMQHFGPTYYSFNRGEIHYVVLDNVFWYGGYMGYLDQDQLDWLKADLALVEKGKTVVVFAHIPVYTNQHIRDNERRPGNASVLTNRDLLYKLLEPYQSHILAGHTHFSDHLRDGSSHIHVCGAVCGAWWSGDICWDGAPNGYSIYQAKGSQVSWQYKSTGKPISHQMRLYKPGAEKLAPNEIVANVWDADENWKIFWYEDGMKKGRMSRRTGKDPLAVEQQTGPELPKKRSWVEPRNNDHMYYAPVSPDSKEVIVE
ncbi:MAG: calcineurin-like phosphoesterase family protein, partial [Bacteroidota bacterium]